MNLRLARIVERTMAPSPLPLPLLSRLRTMAESNPALI